MKHEMMKEIAAETAKATPPVAVVSINHEWTMNHTVMALTIAYLLLQICWLLWRWHKAANGKPIKTESE